MGRKRHDGRDERATSTGVASTGVAPLGWPGVCVCLPGWLEELKKKHLICNGKRNDLGDSLLTVQSQLEPFSELREVILLLPVLVVVVVVVVIVAVTLEGICCR